MSVRQPRLLLISPLFHGYWQSIQTAFEREGYEVVAHCYDAAPRYEKVYNKLRHELPSRLRGEPRHLDDELVTARAIRALDQTRPDRVVVVRGDSLTADFWERVGARVGASALWLYDELRRMTLDLAAVVGAGTRIATYSELDAIALAEQGTEARYLPLAFDPEIVVPDRPSLPEITFIGAAQPKRLALLTHLQTAGLPVRAFGRGWSDHPVDRVRTWRLHGQGLPNGRDLPRPEACSVMRASSGTLNLHGDQDGFTMRTFEAAGVGGVQLIDRADVAGLYAPGEEVFVFNDEAELVELSRRLLRDPAAMARIRENARHRTLAEHTFAHRVRQLSALWD